MGSMGVDVLTSNLTNPQRTYLWEVIIPNMIGGGDGNILQARAQSTASPGRSIDGPINVPYKQTAGINYPGRLRYTHTWQVTFVEGEDAQVFAAIHAWNQSVVHDVSGVSVGDDQLKANLFFKEISTKGGDGLRLKLVGCFPQSVEDVAMGYETNDVKKLVVTFSYDSWEQV